MKMGIFRDLNGASSLRTIESRYKFIRKSSSIKLSRPSGSDKRKYSKIEKKKLANALNILELSSRNGQFIGQLFLCLS